MKNESDDGHETEFVRWIIWCFSAPIRLRHCKTDFSAPIRIQPWIMLIQGFDRIQSPNGKQDIIYSLL